MAARESRTRPLAVDLEVRCGGVSARTLPLCALRMTAAVRWGRNQGRGCPVVTHLPRACDVAVCVWGIVMFCRAWTCTLWTRPPFGPLWACLRQDSTAQKRRYPSTCPRRPSPTGYRPPSLRPCFLSPPLSSCRRPLPARPLVLLPFPTDLQYPAPPWSSRRRASPSTWTTCGCQTHWTTPPALTLTPAGTLPSSAPLCTQDLGTR